jgi:hypothetical protein
MRTKAKVLFSFRQNWEGTWNDLIADPDDKKSKHCWWQGKNAYKELADRRCIPAVLPGDGTPMIRFLLQHLRFHRRFVSDALALSKANQAVIEAFRRARLVFEHQALKAGRLKDELSHWAQVIGKEELLQQLEQSQFWSLTLLPYDKTKWYSVDRRFLFGPNHSLSMVPLVPDPPQSVWDAEEVFRSVRYPSNYTSRANLDTWLQIRAAVVFKLFLSHGLSLLTASRLVVLFYGCAGRGAPINNTNGNAYVSLAHTRRKLTVTGLYEKLKRYGVDEFPFGERRDLQIQAAPSRPDEKDC